MLKQSFKGGKQNKKTSSDKNTPYTYAKASDKTKAFLTDTFMLLIPIVYIVFYFIMGSREEFAQHRLLGWLYIFVPLVIIQTIFMVLSSQTPGYRAYNVQIIDEQTQLKPTLLTILFRNIFAILSFFSIFGWLMMFFREDSKTLHDLLSHTATIYKP